MLIPLPKLQNTCVVRLNPGSECDRSDSILSVFISKTRIHQNNPCDNRRAVFPPLRTPSRAIMTHLPHCRRRSALYYQSSGSVARSIISRLPLRVLPQIVLSIFAVPNSVLRLTSFERAQTPASSPIATVPSHPSSDRRRAAPPRSCSPCPSPCVLRTEGAPCLARYLVG